MAVTAAVRYAINGDKSVFVIPQATYAGLAYAVFVSSALCCKWGKEGSEMKKDHEWGMKEAVK